MDNNSRRLAQFIRANLHIGKADPLMLTKYFLRHYGINQKEFFIWIITEAKRFKCTIESDKGVMNLLQ